jgi:membrane associated rhomboid family serine protease
MYVIISMTFFTNHPLDRIHRMEAFGILAFSLILLYIVLYAAKAADFLLLDMIKLYSGEVWRLVTYQFVHGSYKHLITNIIALSLSIIIALQLESSFKDYSMTYFISGIVAILPIWFLSPFIAMGASTAIYGSFGYLSRSASKFQMKPYLILVFMTGLTVITTVYSYFTSEIAMHLLLKQSLSHLAGLFFGYFFYFVIVKFNARNDVRKLSCLCEYSG